jgi:hypothetical protein
MPSGSFAFSQVRASGCHSNTSASASVNFIGSFQPASSLVRVGFASKRNIARALWYLAAQRLFSHPLITALPDESRTRHPHIDRPRFLITTSSIKNRSAVGQFGAIGSPNALDNGVTLSAPRATTFNPPTGSGPPEKTEESRYKRVNLVAHN